MRNIVKKTSVPITILMILLTVAVHGAYAAENSSTTEAPALDFEEMKSMNIEMMEMNIESLTSMQSDGNHEDLEEPITSLLEQIESLKAELENAEDEEDLKAIMEDFRTVMQNAPEEISKELMGNEKIGEPGKGNMSMGNNTMRGPGGEGNFQGENESMRERNFNGGESAQGLPGKDTSDEGNNGLLSGLINKIKSIFG